METPTTYFPDDLLVKFDFKQPRLWNTSVLSSPTGRKARIKKWLRPKRLMGGTIVGYDDATFATLRDWIDDNMQGQYKSFYAFAWKIANFVQGPKTRQYPNGVVYDALPLTLPYLGGTVTNVYVNGTPTYVVPSTAEVDNGGAGDEVRLTVVDTPLSVGDLIQVDITGTRERIAVHSTKDMDDFGFDFNAAEPPTETPFDFEEL